MDDFTLEQWAAVVGWEGLYEVSDFGRVRSLRRWTPAGMRGGRILKPRRLPKTGYLRVSLCKNGERHDAYIHQLVLQAFVGPCPAGQEVRHLDGNPARNVRSNLCWGTKSENGYDKVRHGTHHHSRKTHCPQGHEYTPETTYHSRGDKEHRTCKLCPGERLERNAILGKICSKDGCETPEWAKGLCRKHYDQQRNAHYL